MGYHRAGFDVVGVDIKPQPRYPFRFIQADAMEFLAGYHPLPEHGCDWTAIHASPPCQGYSSRGGDHPRLIGPVRDHLQAIGVPWVIENIPDARREMRDPVTLCGSMFGLRVRRHRLFECSWPVLLQPDCSHAGQEIVTVAGGGPNPASFHRPKGGGPDRKPRNLADAQDAMGIDWMTRAELNEAIPPSYTLWIGAKLWSLVAGPHRTDRENANWWHEGWAQ